MKLSREGEGGASEAGERGKGKLEQSLTDVGDEPFISAPVLEIERGAVLAGRYQVETTIGRGGSGVVLRAFDRIAQSAVAVKILKPELAADPRWVERFSRELRLARQIQHANVCRVFDLGEADGHRFLTMELASEGTLRTGARGDMPARPLADRIADAGALVSGMAAIHAAGIVHRDVKPENLLRMEDGRLVVSDFGLATSPAQTAAVTLMVGTPSYMAPEMAMGDPASFQSDVWAIGVVMHEILFGKRPEWDITRGQRIFRTPVLSAGQDFPPTLNALAILCGECAAENPSLRPPDAVDVARRFHLARQAVATAVRGGGVSSRRGRWLFAAAGLAAALASIVVRKAWWPWASASLGFAPGLERNLEIGGTPVDISAARRVAVFEGRVHCMSLLPGGRSLRLIAGEPRQAFDLDVESGTHAAAPLRPETYASGCPALSSDGRELLYEAIDATGGHEILRSRSPDGDGGILMTKGRYPVWIPASEDFVFDLDLTHAGVFSIPVMNSSVVSEDLSGRRRLVEKAVSTRGEYLALRYLDDRGENLFVVHSLPTLELKATLSLTGSARNLHFDRRTDQLEVSVDGPRGNSLLALVDWRAGMARYHALLADWDLRDALTDQVGVSFLLSRELHSDVWEYTGRGKPPRQLTADGRNDNAAIGADGALLVQKRTRTGSYIVMLFEAGNPTPTATTAGPSDVMPSFANGGHEWFFVRRTTQAIVHCDAQNSCEEIKNDPQMPAWPIPSPHDQDLAYLTWLNTPRLKVLSLKTGATRDLGAVLIDCAPVWSDDDHVWVVQASQHSREWTEIDVRSGNRAGRRIPVGDGLPESQGCSLDGSTGPARYPEVRVVGREMSGILAIQPPEWR